jgi:hypothetical protein
VFDGADPGSQFDVCGNGDTKDNTLVRKSNVTAGNIDWTSAGCEYDVLAKDDWTNLGFHTCDACGGGGGDCWEDCSDEVLECSLEDDPVNCCTITIATDCFDDCDGEIAEAVAANEALCTDCLDAGNCDEVFGSVATCDDDAACNTGDEGDCTYPVLHAASNTKQHYQILRHSYQHLNNQYKVPR